jgi:hypothetical protein
MSAPVEVIALAATRRADRARFIAAPAPLYRGDQRYVPPLRRDVHRLLDPSTNPWHRHAEVALFLARRGRETVGRIAAVRDRRNDEREGRRVGFFGFFECVDDGACATALLGAAEQWARERGAVAMRGPISPSMDDECGCLVEGFDEPPVIGMPYNPPYYARLFEAAGYRKEQDLLAYEFLTAQEVRPAIGRIADSVMASGEFRVRGVEPRRFWQDVALVHAMYNSAWERNWGFVPLDAAEFTWRAKALKQIIDPRFALFVEARRGEVFEPAGFALAVPDINEILIRLRGRLTPLALFRLLRGLRRVTTIRFILFGVVADYRRRGLEAVLIREVHTRAARFGLRRAELSWILEDNLVMNRTIRKAGGRHYKSYRIFGKRFS